MWLRSRMWNQWRLWNLWSRRRDAPRMTLAGQFLVLQVIVLLVVLACAALFSVRQSDAEFREQRGAPLRAAAQELANRSEEHTSELQSLMRISYAVFCLKKKQTQRQTTQKGTKYK